MPRSVVDFGGGGAFPEIHTPQFPLGMGRDAPSIESLMAKTTPMMSTHSSRSHQISANGTRSGNSHASSSTSLVIVQTPQSQLIEHKFKQSELARPDATEQLATTLATRKVLDEARRKVEQKQSGVSATTATKAGENVTVQHLNTGAGHRRQALIVEQVHDPFEVRQMQAKKQQKVTSHVANAPIIRSPPSSVQKQNSNLLALTFPGAPVQKKEQQAPEDSFNVPAVVKGWTNPKSIIIDLKTREAHDSRNKMQVNVSDKFASLGHALTMAERNEQANQAARKTAAEVAEEIRQREEMDRLEALAKEKVRERQVAPKQYASAAEAREARLQQREREQEEKKKLRLQEKLANRLGMSLDEVAADAGLSNEALQVAPRDRNGVIDPRLQYQTRVGGVDDTTYDQPLFGSSGREQKKFDVGRINAEIARQEADEENARKRQRDEFPPEDNIRATDDSDDDDDPFAIGGLLGKHQS